jgi:hypothetical protein
MPKYRLEEVRCLWWVCSQPLLDGVELRKDLIDFPSYSLDYVSCLYYCAANIQMLVRELNRESDENSGRARRCNRGRTLHQCHYLQPADGKAQQVE